MDQGGQFSLSHGGQFSLSPDRQVADYIKHLDREYGQDFILVYLSPRGEAPSEASFTKEELPPAKSRFRILPYVGREEGNWRDGFDCVRLHEYSLVNWLAECRRACDVDRLRWFLRDGERFCRRQFGEETMSTDSEMQHVEKFLRSDPAHMRTALTVVDAWPRVRARVIDEFNNALCQRIKESVDDDKNIPADVRVLQFRDKRNWGLALTRDVWTAERGRRPQVTLVSENSGLNAWFFGVRQADEKLNDKLLAELGPKSGRDANWNWWRWSEYRDWAAHVPELFDELQQRIDDTVVGGQIMAHHVDVFLDIVRRAVPILNGLDRSADA